MKWTRALATAAKSVEKGSLRWIGRGLLRNAAAEALNKLYKKELIWRRGPWTGADAVEIATLEWVDWYNNSRLHGHCGDIPPAELEAAYYADATTGSATAQPALPALR